MPAGEKGGSGRSGRSGTGKVTNTNWGLGPALQKEGVDRA